MKRLLWIGFGIGIGTGIGTGMILLLEMAL